jgi:hypothetical protein
MGAAAAELPTVRLGGGDHPQANPATHRIVAWGQDMRPVRVAGGDGCCMSAYVGHVHGCAGQQVHDLGEAVQGVQCQHLVPAFDPSLTHDQDGGCPADCNQGDGWAVCGSVPVTGWCGQWRAPGCLCAVSSRRWGAARVWSAVVASAVTVCVKGDCAQ